MSANPEVQRGSQSATSRPRTRLRFLVGFLVLVLVILGIYYFVFLNATQ